MFAESWDEGLDDEQMAAVVHEDSPLVVVAGAGTGKTRTLTARVAWLLERGVLPERILLLTFTRRAADEMMSRAALLAGQRDLARRLRGGTFHAVAHQVIGAWGARLGVDDRFSVLDPSDAGDVMDIIREEHGLSGQRARTPRSATLAELYSRCVNTCRTLSAVVAQDYPWCEPHVDAIATLFKAYVDRKRLRAQLDFDDLLLFWRAALVDDQLGPHLASMFDHVLVDEYQDLNSLQVDIVWLLRPDGRGLTVVGDDAQAIYGFRGADAAHLHALADTLPGARVVRLERNFRSFQPILDVANLVRPDGRESPNVVTGPRDEPVAVPSSDAVSSPPARGAEGFRDRATLEHPGSAQLVLRAQRSGGDRPQLVRCYDANAEARTVVDQVLERHERGLALRDQAILVRAAHHSDLIELELSLRKVPYRKYGGLRYVEAAHVKDFAASLRLLDNVADDVAWFRVLRLHDGVGPARGRRLLRTLPPINARPAVDGSETVAEAPPAARVQLAATFSHLADARAAGALAERVEIVLAMLRPLIAKRYSDFPSRLSDLERLASAASVTEDLSRWLAEIVLDPPASTAERAGPPHVDEDWVVVSTVHSAKGLEWPVVHICHVVDGAFPSDMALRTPGGLLEEQRLFYVAVTRARDELLLYCPLRMPHHRFARDDRHSFAQQSRWLDERVLPALRVIEVPRGTPTSGLDEGLRLPAVVASALSLDDLWR